MGDVPKMLMDSTCSALWWVDTVKNNTASKKNTIKVENQGNSLMHKQPKYGKNNKNINGIQ